MANLNPVALLDALHSSLYRFLNGYRENRHHLVTPSALRDSLKTRSLLKYGIDHHSFRPWAFGDTRPLRQQENCSAIPDHFTPTTSKSTGVLSRASLAERFPVSAAPLTEHLPVLEHPSFVGAPQMLNMIQDKHHPPHIPQQ
ncbi:hypothetical protein CEXT_738511 [Caerostris extrusa]|uniref:Uncharacterized protein n=1 Tax=Caerostris extrusa TaxID=172846 RepID=A0AAV4XMG2_CAEEX|nr:hypothetical protein CEXT_738511 [Caerostris extrusa]